MIGQKKITEFYFTKATYYLMEKSVITFFLNPNAH